MGRTGRLPGRSPRHDNGAGRRFIRYMAVREVRHGWARKQVPATRRPCLRRQLTAPRSWSERTAWTMAIRCNQYKPRRELVKHSGSVNSKHKDVALLPSNCRQIRHNHLLGCDVAVLPHILPTPAFSARFVNTGCALHCDDRARGVVRQGRNLSLQHLE